ncbi:PQ loop repeat-domain-containing protein [Coemansia mojavensis]|nr:PQ loop repeat-domain-containing protein [Coemansia mojavensis]
MAYNKTANEAFAWLGLIFWSFQLAPQAWQNYRRKSTEGVSVIMLYLWFIGNMLYGAYAVADDLYFGLIIQPQLFAFFTLVNILQVYWYAYRWKKRVFIAGLALCVAYAGLHIGFWKADERAVLNHSDGAVTFLGVLPAIFIAVGFFPEFYVCVKEQSVEMSNFFIMLDILGGVFSTISLAFDHTFDYVASITYLVVVLLDIVLALMKLYFHIRGTQGRLHRDDSSTIETQTNVRKAYCLPT